MKNPDSVEKLSWIDKEEYPFKPHYFATSAGNMHYVDEGEGKPVLFIHGNPTWSFQFRKVIRRLSKNCRCIAPDHIGFGLSDKPYNWSYLPVDHAKNCEALIESLALSDITIVVGDWGGPIGASYVINHPDKIINIVITNTWLWSVKHDWYYQLFSAFTGGPIGRFLIKKRNFFARDIMKAAFGDKKKLTDKIHNHYLMPLSDPYERKGTWIFPKQIIGSSDWLGSLWSAAGVMSSRKMAIAWGMKDVAFREKELNTWIARFPDAAVVRFNDAGHFVAEEKPDELADVIEKLLAV
jgi:haloalkane dehalogenase